MSGFVNNIFVFATKFRFCRNLCWHKENCRENESFFDNEILHKNSQPGIEINKFCIGTPRTKLKVWTKTWYTENCPFKLYGIWLYEEKNTLLGFKGDQEQLFPEAPIVVGSGNWCVHAFTLHFSRLFHWNIFPPFFILHVTCNAHDVICGIRVEGGSAASYFCKYYYRVKIEFFV